MPSTTFETKVVLGIKTMISIDQIKSLREKTGISMIECKKALEEANGDENKAIEILKKKGIEVAEKKSGRETKQGIVEAYIHSNRKMGALVEVYCETDFVAKNSQFKELAHNLAMHITAMNPLYLSEKEIPEKVIAEEKELLYSQFKDSGKPEKVIEQIVEGKLKKQHEQICLLSQPFIKNPDITIKQLIDEYIAKLGENIRIGKFVRFEI